MNCCNGCNCRKCQCCCRGERGKQGERGEKGERGEQGERGLRGKQGEQGERGEKGEQGKQGVPGKRGEQGERGEKGEQGKQGPPGKQGPQGVPGKDGVCICPKFGELLINGGMEDFDNNLPFGWDTEDESLLEKITANGRVHAGEFSVGLKDGAVLSQEITALDDVLFYEFSFFAHAHGDKVGFRATVTFITDTGEFEGGEIFVREQDIPSQNGEFGYYKLITTQAPADIEVVRVTFEVTAQGNQMLDLDDTSLRGL